MRTTMSAAAQLKASAPAKINPIKRFETITHSSFKHEPRTNFAVHAGGRGQETRIMQRFGATGFRTRRTCGSNGKTCTSMQVAGLRSSLWNMKRRGPQRAPVTLNRGTTILHTTTFTKWPALLAIVAAGLLAGCSHTTKAPDVSSDVRKALDQAGLKNVSVHQDRDKGVVTLDGHVPGDADKTQAENIARSAAGAQVVSDQIAVVPVGDESDARTMNSDLDKGIEQNLDAALIQSKLRDGVEFAVKNHVVTLTGQVDSQSKRQAAESVAAAVPNVQQVVNELQVKNQKATSSE
jgi:osmotically-inducible protein OsmY